VSEDARVVLAKARQLLEISGSPTPERDASALMDAVSGGLRPWDPLPNDVAARFMQMVTRRTRGEPVSHITQRRAFWKHEFKVTPEVLDPRPDTETLIEQALSVPFMSVLDLGTGSGCILISLLSERPDAHGLGIDTSPEALAVARGNGTRIGVDARCDWAVSDWFSNVSGTFDLIVSNPPYIDATTYETLERSVRDFEPKMALTPGGDGLKPYRILAARARDFLKPSGWLMVEIGYDQGDTVRAIFEENDWKIPELVRDLNGHPRVVKAQFR
jgi:release factor glutamine methyltransferase